MIPDIGERKMKKNRIIAMLLGTSTACMWMSADIKSNR